MDETHIVTELEVPVVYMVFYRDLYCYLLTFLFSHVFRTSSINRVPVLFDS